MTLKIKSIKIFWNQIMNNQSKELFNWKDEWKPIIIFYYNNWFWKTTLFNFIKSTFLWKKIKDNFIDLFQMEVLLNDSNYLIKNWPNIWIEVLLNNQLSTYENFKENLENLILNKNEKLAVAWKNPTWEQNRNTLESLLRFNFFTDDEFKKYTQKECSLINSDLDWDTRGILFNYILWEEFDYNKKKLFKIAYRYWARQKIINDTNKLEKIYSSYFDTNNQISLFENPEEDFNNLLNDKFTTKNILLQIEAIVSNLNDLKNENINFLVNNDIINNLIEKELNHLNESRKDYEKEYSHINKKLSDLKDEYWDLIKWVPTNTQKAIWLRKDALIFVKKYESDVESYYKNNVKLLNEYKELFLKELTKWIFEFKNIWFNNRELKLLLKWWPDEKKWDWRLKTLRFLSLIWIILFKSKNNFSRNLWIWFFDSPFYWVDMENSTNAIKSISSFIDINKLKTQLFIFATKEEKKEKKDTFEEELEKNKNIYFHKYDYQNKEYLIS